MNSIENSSPLKTQNLTPLMKQYWEVKAHHPDKILLFRMGDFFEMFYDDAVNAAPVMGIALTSRNKNSEEKTPMCGVPFHSIGPQINKLLKAGFKVAICDQLEEASQAKGLVRRGVTRILTPGLVFDPETLDDSTSNYLASFDDESVSFLEASTFEAFTFKANFNERQYLLHALRPVEIILSEQQKVNFELGSLQVVLSVQECEKQNDLLMSQVRLKAYLSQMQASDMMTLVEFEMRELAGKMHLSQNSIKSLEIFENYQKETKASLFESIDRSKTSAGKRLLKSWLRFPLVQKSAIEQRLDQVQIFADSENLKNLRSTLSRLGDIERRLSKISSPNVSPRDLLALGDSLAAGLEASSFCPQKIWSNQDLSSARHCIELILTRINEEAPVTLKHGNVIKSGVSKELDECLALSTGAQDLLSQLEATERELTGISSLKIRYNNIFGYYIEITNTHKDKVPVARYERKQTLAGSERYMTKELSEIETKVLGSQAKKLELEIQLFEDLRQRILKNDSVFLRLAREWAEVDVLSALAHLALEQDYKRPRFINWDKANALSIKASRHPVIEQNLKVPFKANDIHVGLGDCMLLTGPNMAGKSTLMRQVAIASLMAQTGSFVACESAELPIFDQIFTRIGANDFLSEGLSTFMVEMKETAEILSGATAQSLVILDEIGRGTSTYDGMSLAQAILEHLLTHISCVTFFATHYHELTELTHQFLNLKSAHMRVSEVGGEVRFLHTLTQGSASKSYGIHVAKLAGLPKTLTLRAANILKDLEEVPAAPKRALPQLSFNMVTEAPRAAVEFLKNLRALHLEKMTPIEAMMCLSQFQTQLTGSEFEEFLNS
jgi:DNA mismatch repair protein MutS